LSRFEIVLTAPANVNHKDLCPTNDEDGSVREASSGLEDCLTNRLVVILIFRREAK
jgi:hypothetical protein